MPLPLFLGIGAAIAGLTGIGTGVYGAVKMKEAKDTMESAQNRHERNLSRFKQDEGSAIHVMDELGKLEMTIVASFTQFSDLIEKIQNRPEFASVSKEGAKPLKYNPEELKQASVGAGVLLGGMGGAAVGTAAGFAAAGATTAAVMALGTAFYRHSYCVAQRSGGHQCHTGSVGRRSDCRRRRRDCSWHNTSRRIYVGRRFTRWWCHFQLDRF